MTDTTELVRCACGEVALRQAIDGAPLCVACAQQPRTSVIWHPQAMDLPFSAEEMASTRAWVTNLRTMAHLLTGDDVEACRWVATLDRAEQERDEARQAFRDAVRDVCEATRQSLALVQQLTDLRVAVRAFLDDPAQLTLRHDCDRTEEETRRIEERVRQHLQRLADLCPKEDPHG